MQRGLFDLSCAVCGRTMIDTGSGYVSCPMGHGKLVKDVPALEQFAPPDMFSQVQAEPRDCSHCGRDVALHVWELGGRHCVRCLELLNKNAELSGVVQ